jgi:flagellar biosynthesis protein FlhG
MKLLAARNGLMSYDLLLGCDPMSPRRERIAPQLADTADRFLGAVLQDWALVDPASDLQDLPTPELLRLAQRLVQADDEAVVPAGGAPLSHPARTFAQATTY